MEGDLALTFSEILGQETAKKFLRQVLASRKIPHAYLFTGISGIGKTTTAMAFAMALNCREPMDHAACGECPTCRQFLGGNFPDFLSIYPEGRNIGIEQIKAFNRSLSFAPVSGGYRVSVIHQAEAMSEEAANSYLKTLEEPPLGNILILKTVEPLDLLPTIVSRCQKVPFKPLSTRDIQEGLMNKTNLDPETAFILAGLSSGSMGRALSMAESDFLEKRKEWLGSMMGLSEKTREEALVMAVECAEVDRKKGLDMAGSEDTGMMDMLSVWGNWFRDLLVVRVNGSRRLLVNPDYTDQLKKYAGSYNVNSLTESIRAIYQAQNDIRRMRNPVLVLEHAIMNLKKLSET